MFFDIKFDFDVVFTATFLSSILGLTRPRADGPANLLALRRSCNYKSQAIKNEVTIVLSLDLIEGSRERGVESQFFGDLRLVAW